MEFDDLHRYAVHKGGSNEIYAIKSYKHSSYQEIVSVNFSPADAKSDFSLDNEIYGENVQCYGDEIFIKNLKALMQAELEIDHAVNGVEFWSNEIEISIMVNGNLMEVNKLNQISELWNI